MKNSEIKEKLAEGYIHFNTIIEMVGKPKEHVQNTIKDYVKNLEEHEYYKVTKKDISKPKKTNDGFFSTFAELDILVNNVDGVFAFCFNVMPASLEILEPRELVMDNIKFTDNVNELLAKIHEVDMVAKVGNQKIANISQNFNSITSNFVVYACSVKPKTSKEVSAITGLPEDALLPLLDVLITSKKLKKENDKYTI